MRAWLYGTLRTLAQSGASLIVGYLATRGLNLPTGAAGWIADVVIIGGSIFLGTAALKWLETRQGDGIPARLARGLAKVIMLGLTGNVPVYVKPAVAASGEALAGLKPVGVIDFSGKVTDILR